MIELETLAFPNGRPLRLGVVSDTHVPDRAQELHPGLIPRLAAAQVDLILHSGDISTPAVLEALAQVAPVRAVRGNRDFAFLGKLPLVRAFQIGPRKLVLMHGHGGWLRYLLDKVEYIRHGYRLERYHDLLMETLPQADGVIFGHTHFVENVWKGGKLLFNAGSASMGSPVHPLPSFGVLSVAHDGQMQAEVVALTGMRREGRKWVDL